MRRENLILAHQIGSFVGMSKQRPLDEILRRFDGPQQRPEMTGDEIRSAMGVWMAGWAGQAGRAA